MKVRLSNPALLVVLAALSLCLSPVVAQPIAPAGANRGQDLIRLAATRVAEHPTLEARLRVRTNLLGQPLVGSGEYAQLRSSAGLLLRLELSIQSGRQVTSIKQISNGRDLWEHWRIAGTERVHRVDLRRLEAAARQTAGASLATPSTNLASGGLPKLLKQLDANFDFNRGEIREARIGELPVWLVIGVWKPSRLAQTVPEAVDGESISFDQIPSHLPHQVEVWLGKQEAFPYRITYDRLQARDGAFVPKPAVTMEFFGVAPNVPLDPSQFHYPRPQNVAVIDRTDAVIKAMGLKVGNLAGRPSRPSR